MSPPSIYISSTYEDLKAYREAVFSALEKAGFLVGRMEGYAASDERPLRNCLNDVETRDVYVGIFGWRYGYIPPKEHGNPNGWSITECEYRHAVAKNKPVLCFFLDEKAAADWPDAFKDEQTGAGEGGARIRTLRSDLGTEKSVDFFRSPEQLAYQVLAAIVRRGTVRRPFMVPPLPADFVPRPEVTSAMVASLLAEDTETLAVHGSAGFGKTTLAVAVCHEPEVVKAFPDGTVWVTLGDKDPQLERKLAEIYAAFTGNQPVETTVVGIVSEIRQKLSGKRCLIAVDDVWNDTDLKPFADLGANRLMFTTRKREMAVDHSDVEVKEMAAGESMQLLTRGMPDASNHQAALATFVDELGGWALLLELTNARLLIETRAQRSFEAAFAYVRKLYQQRGVTGFDRKDTRERNKSVTNCLDTGLDAYKETVPTLRARAAELGLFPEDIAIPEQVLSEYWDCDEPELNEDTLRHLDDLSIIRWDRKERVVRLHDSVRGVLATWVPDKPASHRRLLNTWGDAKRLPHAYAWQWYGWHCLQADRREEFCHLLVDFDWIQAKLKASEIAGLIVEYNRATAGENAVRTGAERKVDREQESLFRMQSVLNRSAHVLAHDKTQLAAQLLARIPEEELLRDKIRARTLAIPYPWLMPLTASLAAEQSVRWLKPSGEALSNVAFSRNGRWAAHVSSPPGESTSNVFLWDLEKWQSAGPKFRTLARLNPFALALSDDARWCLYADSLGGVHRLGPAGEVWKGSAHRKVTIAQWLGISADGKRALSACHHGRLVAWDIEADHHQMVWDENDNNVLAMSLDSTGTRAVVARADGSVVALELWPSRQRILCRLHGRPTALATSSDHTVIVVANDSGRIEVRRFDSPEPAIGNFFTEEEPTTVAVSADARYVSVGTAQGTVEVWSLPLSGRTARYSRAHTYEVERIAFSYDGARVISADRLHIKEWALNAPIQRESAAQGSHATGQVKVTADGLHAVALLEDGRLGVWNLRTGTLESALPRGDRAVVGTAHGGTKGGISLATKAPHILAWNEAYLCVWNLATGACVGSLGVTETRDACITPDGKSVVYVDGRNISLWRPQESNSKTLGTYTGDLPSHIAISPDGRYALSSGGDRQVHLWSLSAPTPGSVQETLRTIRSRAGRSSFAPDASYWPDSRDKPSTVVFVGPSEALATTGDGSVFLLHTNDDPSERTKLDGMRHPGRSDGTVARIVVDPERRIFLTSSSYSQTITVWDMDEPYRTATISGRAGFVHKLNATAERILLTTYDGLLRIALLRDGTVLAAFQGDKQIVACDADAEMNWVVALDQGGQMHFFHLEQGLSGTH